MKFNVKILIFGFYLVVLFQGVYGQQINGFTVDKRTGLPIEYVNIGLINKNYGTVSDQAGKFSLVIEPQYKTDSILFSCIGYQSVRMQVYGFINIPHMQIAMEEKIVELKEIIILPKKFVKKTFGVTASSKSIAAGFGDNKLGYECGLLMKNKKSAILEKLTVNIASCSYDTVFYRVNVYSVNDADEFVNILNKPIYFEFSKNEIADCLTIDLKPYNIIVTGNFLLTIEHIKDLGPGHLYFCAGFSKKTYFRKTSQGNWESAAIGVSISIEALVEK